MNQVPSKHMRTFHVILVILLVGFLLRMFDLETKGLWLDEIHSAVAADPDHTLAGVIKHAEADQPPVYFIVLHEWYKMTSYGDFDGRLLSVIIGLLGILAMYFLGKEFKDHKLGIVAAFFTAINYFHIDHSRQVRFYPFLFLFALLSFLFFIRCLKNKRSIDFLWYTLFTSLLLNTHYFGMVVFLSQFLLFLFIIIWKKITDIKFILQSSVSGIFAGLSFLHWLPVIVSDLQINAFHIASVKWYFLIQYFYVYFGDPVSSIIFGILFLLAVRIIILRFKSRSHTIEDVVLVGWIVMGFLIPLIYSWLKIPMLESKYTFVVLPAILLIVALGFDIIQFKEWSFYLIPVLIFSLFFNALFFKRLYQISNPPEQWREVTREIMKSDKDTQWVFSEYAWYFRYYFKIYKGINQPLEPRYANFKATLSSARSIWVLTSTRFPDKGLSQKQQQELEAEFDLAETVNFTDSYARHYIRR
ncbi:MAG: glycosyltransferase family 39 protein [Bacteroidetes bacterium]|nr:glycosyltransferase family 39 protein [Bacteroidota bacterium]